MAYLVGESLALLGGFEPHPALATSRFTTPTRGMSKRRTGTASSPTFVPLTCFEGFAPHSASAALESRQRRQADPRYQHRHYLFSPRCLVFLAHQGRCAALTSTRCRGMLLGRLAYLVVEVLLSSGAQSRTRCWRHRTHGTDGSSRYPHRHYFMPRCLLFLACQARHASPTPARCRGEASGRMEDLAMQELVLLGGLEPRPGVIFGGGGIMRHKTGAYSSRCPLRHCPCPAKCSS